MDIRRVELMRDLQREYYEELRRKREFVCKYGVHVSPRMLLFYRLCAVGFLGFWLTAIVNILIKLVSR